MRRIGILTTGGDCPGLNPAIRAVVRTALAAGAEVLGFHRGWKGLVEDDVLPMDARTVGGIINRGGTILHTSRCPEFHERGTRDVASRTLERREIDGLVVLGGNGSLRGASELGHQTPVPIVGIPKTIDNDVGGTDYAIGFDTAVNSAVEAIDKIRDTATSHERLFLVEVMGRDRGFLALEVALASGAEDVLLPESATNIDQLIAGLQRGKRAGKVSSIVVVAEGDEAGSGYDVARQIRERCAFEVRVSVLGYLQRGGAPSARDRVVGSLFGKRAVDALRAGERAKMVALSEGAIVLKPIEAAWKETRPLDENRLELARLLST